MPAIIKNNVRSAALHGRTPLCFPTIRSEVTPTPIANGKIASAELKILDSLSLHGLRTGDPGIKNALNWLTERHVKDGSFRLKLLRDRDRNLNYWVCLAICRVFRRFYSSSSQ